MRDHNLPTKPGLYWATDLPCSTKWEFIIKVSGKAPLLMCKILDYREYEPLSYMHKCPEVLYYGPKIEMPERNLQAISQN